MSKRFVNPIFFSLWWCVVFFIFLIWLLRAPALAQTKPPADLSGKSILVLHAYESNIPIFELTDRGLRTTLDAGGVSIRNQFFEYLDLARNPGSEHRKLLVEQMRIRYGHRKFDMIVTMYAEALEFVLKDCREVFRDSPIVALYLPYSSDVPKTDRSIIGLFPTRDIIGTLEIALKLVPGAKRVYVVSGVNKVDILREEEARLISKKWKGQLEFLYLNHMPLEDILATVSKAPPGSIVLALGFSKDVTGKNYTTVGVAQQLSKVSAAPVFGFLSVTLGHGIIGGSLISFEHIGIRTGQLALDILRGTKTADDIPAVFDVPSVPMFDWQQLRRWKLNETALPKGSVVINRETTLWDFKYYIMGGLILCLLEFFLIAALARQNRRRKMAEEELRERLRFEQLVSGLSAKFLTASSNDVDREIDGALNDIIKFFDVSRCVLVRGFPAEKRALIVHEAHADDFLPTPPTANLYDFVPWTFSKMAQGEALNFTSIEGLPAEAGGDKQFYRNLGVRSILMVPIDLEGVPGYALSISSHKEERVWSADYISRLQLFGKIIVNRIVREQAEELLRRKTEELDQFFDVSQDLLCIASTDAYFLRLNPVWERVLGFSREELMAKPFLDFVHPDDLLKTQEAVSAQRSRQKVINFDNRYRCKDGTYRWLEWNSVPAGRLIYAAARDITDRKQVEDALEDRLQFEQLVSEISARFLNVASLEIDRDIEIALKGIINFFHVDRCVLIKGSPDEHTAFITHAASAVDLPPVPLGGNLYDAFPWTSQMMAQGEIIDAPTIDELPTDASVEKEFYRNLGVRSLLMIPMHTKGLEGYSISISSDREKRVWPRNYISRLELLVKMFVNALERKRAEEAMEERLRFERLVSDISAKFLDVAPQAVDREIEDALRRIVDFFDVSHAMLIKGFTDEQIAVITHASHADDVPPSPLGGNLYTQFPWTSRVFGQNEIIRITTLDELPAEASPDKEIYRHLGVRSFLMVPIVIEGLAKYVVSISSRREERVWPGDYVSRLELLGEIFVNTIARKESAESLRKAEEKYRSIFEGALEGIFEISMAEVKPLSIAPSGEAQQMTINPALARMLGYNSADEIASWITRARDQLWVNPNDRETFSKMLRERNVVRGFECQIWRKDWTKIWVSINGQQGYGPDGKTILYSGFVEDITHRKKAEEALRESEERFRQVAENVGDFIWEIDANGLYSYTSPSVEKILGYRPEELVGKKHFYDLFVPDAREELKSAALKVFAEKQSFRGFPNPNLRKDGKIVHLETSGRPILDGGNNLVGYRGADTDVTERKFAEEAMEERLRFERLRSDLSARFVDIPPGRVDTEINRALKEILEFFQVDRCALIRILPGKGSWQITHLAISEGVPQVPVGIELSTSNHPWVYHKLIEKGEIVSVSGFDDLPAEANADKQTWIGWGIRSTLSIPILMSEGTAHVITLNSVKSQTTWREELFPRLRLLGEIFVTALKHKQSEMEVNRARQQLLHVERSARLGELTASLAHELNQPLAAILSNAQAALRFLQSDQVNLDEFREILNDIIHDDQRAGNVIRGLRSMMKREERERSPVILNNVVNDVTQIFNTESIFRNVHIETEFDESLPPVLADKIQLQQVMLNLIVNAADAVSQSPPEGRKIILRTQVKDDKIRVTIRDFGPGINKGDLDRIFQPFFTTKGTGLGMGLAVSETIVEAHGGRIWAENSPDGGATFFIELPIISDQ